MELHSPRDIQAKSKIMITHAIRHKTNRTVTVAVWPLSLWKKWLKCFSHLLQPEGTQRELMETVGKQNCPKDRSRHRSLLFNDLNEAFTFTCWCRKEKDVALEVITERCVQAFIWYDLQMPGLFQSHPLNSQALLLDWLWGKTKFTWIRFHKPKIELEYPVTLLTKKLSTLLPIMVSVPAIGGVWLGTPKLLEPEWKPAGWAPFTSLPCRG